MGLELQDYIICPGSPSFEFRAVSLQAWPVSPLGHPWSTSVPPRLCPKTAGKLRLLVSECESARPLGPRQKTVVGRRQEEKKHFLEQVNFGIQYSPSAIFESASSASAGYSCDRL